MKIIQTPQSNVEIKHLNNSPAILSEDGNIKCFTIAFMASKDDLDSLNQGQPIYLNIYQIVPPLLLFTINKEGLPNL